MQFLWRSQIKIIGVVLLLLCAFVGFAQSNPEHWDAKYYTGYSVQTFKQLPAVHKKIVGSKFNHRLLDAAIFLEPMKSASDTICQNFIFQLH